MDHPSNTAVLDNWQLKISFDCALSVGVTLTRGEEKRNSVELLFLAKKFWFVHLQSRLQLLCRSYNTNFGLTVNYSYESPKFQGCLDNEYFC